MSSRNGAIATLSDDRPTNSNICENEVEEESDEQIEYLIGSDTDEFEYVNCEEDLYEYKEEGKYSSIDIFFWLGF